MRVMGLRLAAMTHGSCGRFPSPDVLRFDLTNHRHYSSDSRPIEDNSAPTMHPMNMGCNETGLNHHHQDRDHRLWWVSRPPKRPLVIHRPNAVYGDNADEKLNSKRTSHSRIRYPNNYLVNVLELPKMHTKPFRHPPGVILVK